MNARLAADQVVRLYKTGMSYKEALAHVRQLNGYGGNDGRKCGRACRGHGRLLASSKTKAMIRDISKMTWQELLVALTVAGLAASAMAALSGCGPTIIRNDDGSEYISDGATRWLKTPSGYFQKLPAGTILP